MTTTTPENMGKYKIWKNTKNMPKPLLSPTCFVDFGFLNRILVQFMHCNVCVLWCIIAWQFINWSEITFIRLTFGKNWPPCLHCTPIGVAIVPCSNIHAVSWKTMVAIIASDASMVNQKNAVEIFFLFLYFGPICGL